MNRTILSKHAALLIIVIFLLNFLAQKFYWYYTIWSFDMFMHFSGGLLLSFLFFWIFNSFQPTIATTIKVLLGVLVIGICWELFEIIFHNYVAQNHFNLIDTMSDICFDLAGGLCGILYVYKKVGDMKETTI